MIINGERFTVFTASEKKHKRWQKEDCPSSLTVLRLEVGKAELGALVCDQDLSIEGEDHGLVLHVAHAAHHVARVPTPAEETAAHVQPVTLK